jgi:hypothetical protein
MAEANDSLPFLTALAELATRMAADGVVIHSVTYQTQGFGRWEVEAGRRRVRIRLSWDGKDKQLRVETAGLVAGSAERHWQLAEEHDFRKRRPDTTEFFNTIRAAIAAHAGL